jgi:cyclopropane-fatty-acyl-phospholipid synthase
MDDKDYLWRGNQPLKEKIEATLKAIGYSEPIHRIELISFAKYFNIIFRPVSFFLCYNKSNSCQLVLTEVHNTFRETHLYALKNPYNNSTALSFEIPKAFHVSPFFNMKGKYKIHFKDDGKEIDIAVELIKSETGEEPVLLARLTGQGLPLEANNLYKTLLKYPFNAFLNMPRILLQAFNLYFKKKLLFFQKPVPHSEFTMRKQLPSWLARQSMKSCFSFFSKQSVGKIEVTLPEGERRVFGSESSGVKADLQIKDYRFFSLLARNGEIGLGIAYEQGFWKSDDLVQFMDFMLSLTFSKQEQNTWYSRLVKKCYIANIFCNKNTINRAKKNISKHYDLSNKMYEMFLDETMTYSCAIFDYKNEPLIDAQLRKIDRILEKACLSKNHHLLEIGTGWGSLAIRAAKLYGCRVTSITLSKEQQQLAQQRIAQAGLSEKMEVLLCDYRNITGQYDRIISVEMLEAVGKSYLPAFFCKCDRLLKTNGMMVIQTITIPDQRYEAYSKTTDWIRLFIFPGGHLPSLTALTKVLTEQTSFIIKEVESIGPHYALTLERWKESFLANSEKIIGLGFPETFIRRWEYYFTYCQTGFAQHYIDDLQIVLSRPRNLGSIKAFDQIIGSSKNQKDT